MANTGFDSEVLGKCEVGVMNYYPDGMDVIPCGKPACYRVWYAEDRSDAMRVCQEHKDLLEVENA